MTSLADEIIENIELICQPEKRPSGFIVEVEGRVIGKVSEFTASAVVLQQQTLRGVRERRFVDGRSSNALRVPDDGVQIDVDAMLALVRASIAWAQDTGDCHFCGQYAETREHDEECPVRPFDERQAPGIEMYRDPSEYPIVTAMQVDHGENVEVEDVDLQVTSAFDLDAVPGREGSALDEPVEVWFDNGDGRTVGPLEAMRVSEPGPYGMATIIITDPSWLRFQGFEEDEPMELSCPAYTTQAFQHVDYAWAPIGSTGLTRYRPNLSGVEGSDAASSQGRGSRRLSPLRGIGRGYRSRG